MHRKRLRVSNAHGHALFQLLFAANAVQRTSHHTELDIGNLQVVIQLNDSLADQLVSLEIYSIVRLMIDSAP